MQALYLVLSNDVEQCKHLLAGKHSLTSGYMTNMKELLHEGFHAALRYLRDKKAPLHAQLFTAACLARLCTQVRSNLPSAQITSLYCLWHLYCLLCMKCSQFALLSVILA